MTQTRRQRLEKLMRHPVVDVVVMVLIIVSVSLLVVGLVLPPDAPQQPTVAVLSQLITVLFVFELSLRWLAEPVKRRFWERYWLDCLAVLPAFRWFRFLWLLRLLRLFRFGIILSRRLSAFSALVRSGAMETLVLVVSVAILVVAGALGIRMAEGETMAFQTLEESLWWSVLSLVAAEPIGHTPDTAAGRAVVLGVMVSGIVVFAVITGIVSATMVERLRNLNVRYLELEDLSGHVIICGWNPAAIRVLRELQADREYQNRGVVVVSEFDQEPDLAELVVKPSLIFFLTGDYTRPDVLLRAGIERASRAIVLADRSRERSDQDRDARSVLTALLIENINQARRREIFTSVELVNRDNAQSLVAAGVEEVVVAHDYVGTVLASSTRNVGMTKILDELLTAEYGNQFIKLVLPDELGEITVETLSARLKERCNAILIATEDADDPSELIVNPPSSARVQGGQIAVIVAPMVPDVDVLV